MEDNESNMVEVASIEIKFQRPLELFIFQKYIIASSDDVVWIKLKNQSYTYSNQNEGFENDNLFPEKELKLFLRKNSTKIVIDLSKENTLIIYNDFFREFIVPIVDEYSHKHCCYYIEILEN